MLRDRAAPTRWAPAAAPGSSSTSPKSGFATASRAAAPARRRRRSPHDGPVLTRVNILGINAYHGDVSAALVRDGELVAAVEEERFRRIKHVRRLSAARRSRACLEMARHRRPPTSITSRVSRDPRAHLWRKALFALRHRPTAALVRDRARATIGQRRRAARRRSPTRSASTTARRAPAHPLGRASPGAPGERVLRLAVRRGGGVRDRRLRRLRQHVVGRRPRIDARRRWTARSSRTRSGMLYLAITQYLGFHEATATSSR